MRILSLLLLSFSIVISIWITFPRPAWAYLDPGTGSYLFQILIAVFVGGIFTVKIFWHRIVTLFNRIIHREANQDVKGDDDTDSEDRQ